MGLFFNGFRIDSSRRDGASGVLGLM